MEGGSALSTKSEEVSYGVFKFTTDGPLAYLAKAKDVFPHIPQIAGSPTPASQGSVDDFIAKHNNDPALLLQMKNKVRKCAHCGKPNAYTLPDCNQCGQDLKSVEISYTNNVFTGFMYGIEKGPFPFTISIRLQDPEFLVFDDLLSLCPGHLNSVPTTLYMADWRNLLTKPAKGLKLVNDLFDHCWSVAKQQFFSNSDWRRKIIKGDYETEEKIETLRDEIVAGFNSPPSQYQLHLQFMMPPFLPFQYYLYLKGVHFTYQRFFPIEYVRKILGALIAAEETYTRHETDTAEETIKFFKEKYGIDYDVIHKECYEKYGASHRKLANWNPSDFEAVILDDKLYALNPADGAASMESSEKGEIKEDVKVVQANDKVTLQNYGRPYKDGKPIGSFYALAKHFPNDVSLF